MKNKKLIIKISIILGVILLSIGGILLYKYMQVKNAIVKVELKDNLEADFADTLRVSSFIKKINGKIVDDYVIDTDSLGMKKINFQYINDDGIKIKYSYEINVVDKEAPLIWLGKSYNVVKGSEDNLLENGLDSLLLSQISGRIVSDIQEAQGMRFDEILRASLTMPTIMGIAQYISDCKNPSKNQMHSNAGNQTRNSYTVVYIFGDNENEIRDVLIEKLSASNISCKRVGGQEIIERCHEDISVKKKYIIAFSEMASLCITKASELLGENIIINRIFLINPSKAKESDLYLGDISIIDGNSVAIKSWEKAVLGNVREFESNSNDIFDIIMRELENDK